MTQEIWSNKRALTVVTTHPRLLGKVCPLSRPPVLIFGPEKHHNQPTEVTQKAYDGQNTPVVRLCMNDYYHL